MTDYRALASNSPGTSFTPGGPWSLGHEFYVTSSGMSVRGIWYFRGSAACTATPTGAIYQVDSTGLTGPMVPYTYIAFPTSTVGVWTYQPLPNPVPIAANTSYRVVVYTGLTAFYYTSNFWVSPGAGASGITNGPLVMPNGVNATGYVSGKPMQGTGNSVSGSSGTNPGSIQFPSAYSTSQLWPVDVTVTDVSYPNPVEINPHVTGNTAWQNSLATPITAQALENFESFSDSNHPLQGFRTNRTRIQKNEALNVAPLNEATIFDTTGPGVVRYIWFATGGNVGSLDCRIRIYYDGSTTPAVDQDLGTLFAMHWAGTQANGVPANNFNNTVFYSSVATPHMHVEEANTFNCAYTIKFPIPFGNRVRITYYNPNASSTVGFYSMVYYHYSNTDQANGIRLRGQGLRYADGLTNYTAAAVVPLANITTGPGWVVWLSQVGGITATNGSWMERNLNVQIDGDTAQGSTFVTTGTEDTFDSAWYFEGWHFFNCGPDSWVGADFPGATSSTTQYVVGMATDYLSKLGGIYFNNTCVMSFQPEPACTSADSRVWCVLYYN